MRRISFFVQTVAAAEAVLFPMLAIVTGFTPELLAVTLYAWLIVMVGAFWHRLTVPAGE